MKSLQKKGRTMKKNKLLNTVFSFFNKGKEENIVVENQCNIDDYNEEEKNFISEALQKHASTINLYLNTYFHIHDIIIKNKTVCKDSEEIYLRIDIGIKKNTLIIHCYSDYSFLLFYNDKNEEVSSLDESKFQKAFQKLAII